MSNKIQAVILAGGKGTRLAPLTDNLPKPLVPVLGRPMMLYVLEHLKAAGITNVAIAVAHLGHLIEQEFGTGGGLGMQISYLKEPEPMGTGGWSKLVDWSGLADDFLVLNADNLFWIDVAAFIARHKEAKARATIAAIEIPSETAINYELLAPNTEHTRLLDYVDRTRGQELRAKPTVFVSSGWYIMTPAVREHVPGWLPVSNEAHIWPALAQSGAPLGFYRATEPWFDSGTHERLARVEAFLRDKYNGAV